MDQEVARKAIVTGGGGAIGGAVAQALARRGCDVALLDKAPTSAVSDLIRALGSRVFEFQTDLADMESARSSVAAAVEKLGGLDIVVNAAGIVSAGSFATLPEAEWDRIMAVNLKSVFVCCQAAISPLRQSERGRIINIGSVLAKNGGNARPWLEPSEQDRSGNVAYGVSKAGVHALTAYLARELASAGITVNAVAPGPIQTHMTAALPDGLKALIPIGRMGRPDEVAELVAFLASDAAGFMTGEIVDINGGLWID